MTQQTPADVERTEDCYQLTYVSRSVIDPDPDVLSSALKDILRTANQFNSKHEITGTLCYAHGQFCQVLEGEPELIEQLFEKIQRDPRHVACRLLSFQPIEKRMFPRWSMKFARVDQQAGKKIDGVLNARDRLAASPEGAHVVEQLLDQLERTAEARV